MSDIKRYSLQLLVYGSWLAELGITAAARWNMLPSILSAMRLLSCFRKLFKENLSHFFMGTLCINMQSSFIYKSRKVKCNQLLLYVSIQGGTIGVSLLLMADKGWYHPIRDFHLFAAGIPWCKNLLMCFHGYKYSQMSPFFLSGLDAILRWVGNLTATISLTDRIMLHVGQSNAIQKSFIHSTSMPVLQFAAAVCIIARDAI